VFESVVGLGSGRAVTEGEAMKEKMTKRMKGTCILMVWG
jgi:hypothetical protein